MAAHPCTERGEGVFQHPPPTREPRSRATPMFLNHEPQKETYTADRRCAPVG
jgi:hypothetical protein